MSECSGNASLARGEGRSTAPRGAEGSRGPFLRCVHTDIKPAPVHPAPVPPRDSAVPLTADLRRVHYTVSKRFLDKLDRARDALSHSDPGASVEQFLEKGRFTRRKRRRPRERAADATLTTPTRPGSLAPPG